MNYTTEQPREYGITLYFGTPLHPELHQRLTATGTKKQVKAMAMGWAYHNHKTPTSLVLGEVN